MDWFYKCFITQNMEYCLLDSQGDIRATACSIAGIVEAKAKAGFGKIHKVEFDGKILKIGKMIK